MVPPPGLWSSFRVLPPHKLLLGLYRVKNQAPPTGSGSSAWAADLVGICSYHPELGRHTGTWPTGMDPGAGDNTKEKPDPAILGLSLHRDWV